MAKHTGKKIAEIERDTDRDNFMSSEEAVKYGLIDAMISSQSDLVKMVEDK